MLKRILIIDDDEIDARCLNRAFAQLGESIVTEHVDDSTAALDAIDRLKPDLITLDLNMPILNGFEILRRLKAHEDYRSIPTIIVSTSSNPDDVRTCMNDHANAYITKPETLGGYSALARAIDRVWFHGTGEYPFG